MQHVFSFLGNVVFKCIMYNNFVNYTTNMYVYIMVVLKVISEVATLAFILHYTCKRYTVAVIGNWMIVVWHP